MLDSIDSCEFVILHGLATKKQMVQYLRRALPICNSNLFAVIVPKHYRQVTFISIPKNLMNLCDGHSPATENTTRDYKTLSFMSIFSFSYRARVNPCIKDNG